MKYFNLFLILIVHLCIACTDEISLDENWKPSSNLHKLVVSTKVVNISSEGGTSLPLYFSSSSNCTVTKDGDWFTISQSDKAITAKAAVNNTNKIREGSITISVANLSTVVIVRQVTTEMQEMQEYVDLGLPSGTLWATCNIGAKHPEEYGDYFAWGEVEPKETYDWSTYKYNEGSNKYIPQITKYYSEQTWASDNKKELDPEDDAAYVNWGHNWRMPTKEQIDELHNTYGDIERNTILYNGRKGLQVKNKRTGVAIFLPISGYRHEQEMYYSDYYGHYWTRSLESNEKAYYLKIWQGAYEYLLDRDFYKRCDGFSIRPVYIK